MEQEQNKKVRQIKDRERKKAQRAKDRENVDELLRKRAVLNERERIRYHKVRSSLDQGEKAAQKQKWKESKRKYRERKASASSCTSQSTQVLKPVEFVHDDGRRVTEDQISKQQDFLVEFEPLTIELGALTSAHLEILDHQTTPDEFDPFASNETCLNYFIEYNI